MQFVRPERLHARGPENAGRQALGRLDDFDKPLDRILRFRLGCLIDISNALHEHEAVIDMLAFHEEKERWECLGKGHDRAD